MSPAGRLLHFVPIPGFLEGRSLFIFTEQLLMLPDA